MVFPHVVARDAIGARAGDDRVMIRSLINMLVWNLVVVVLIVVLW